MNKLPLFILLFLTGSFQTIPAHAVLLGNKNLSVDEARALLEPHKAIYDIDLVATRSGSSIINISGKMMYEWKPTCDGWITDHKFNLFYEYADGPGMKVTSDFSTYESFDGKDFNFTSKRKRNDRTYEQFLGHAGIDGDESQVTYTTPDDLEYDLSDKTFFPMAHTVALIQKAYSDDKFFKAVVFDGSDDEGPVEINAFIGEEAEPSEKLKTIKHVDKDMLEAQAWNIRMAVFNKEDEAASSDYEMSVVFHENGVISEMLVDYDDFSVSQDLVALEKLEHNKCVE